MEDKNLEYPLSALQAYRPNYAQLMSELQKYVDLGNIVDAVKDYKQNETSLDIQLRAFKQQKDE